MDVKNVIWTKTKQQAVQIRSFSYQENAIGLLGRFRIAFD